jgi:hypothetical protein
MTKKQIGIRNRSWSTRTVLIKLGPNDAVTQAVIDAFSGQIDGLEGVEETRDDARTDHSVREVKLRVKQGPTLWRRLIRWYGVARGLVTDATQEAALDRITTGDGGYSLERVERRAKETRTALTQFPEGFTAVFSKAQLEAEIDSLLSEIVAVDGLKADAGSAETTLKAAFVALDAENKRIYAILTALFDVPGTVEYDLVHTIPTEEDADDDEEDGEAPSLPPEK